MIKKRVIVGCFFILLLNIKGAAQDAFFSQFYSAPTFLSPSLAGSTGGARTVVNSRLQWPGISTSYQTYAISADLYSDRINSGFGALFVEDKAGSADLNTLYLGLQYAYRVQLNADWIFVPGLQFTLGQKSINRNKLVFPDELVSDSPSNGQIYLTNTKSQYFDLASSIFLSSPKLWTGLVFDHLLRPNYSFMGDNARIPFKFVSFGGMNIWRSRGGRTQEPRTASLCYRFEYQNSYKQLDLGAYWYGRVADFGVWYRGFPVFHNENLKNYFIDNDAIVLTFGIKRDFKVGAVNWTWHFAYSYDLQLSSLAVYGAGAHEISIVLERGNCLKCFPKKNNIQF